MLPVKGGGEPFFVGSGGRELLSECMRMGVGMKRGDGRGDGAHVMGVGGGG